MMTTCCAIVGLVFLVLTNLAIIIAFATPYWIMKLGNNYGLWAYCDIQTCTWFFQDSPYTLVEGPDQMWWLATQGLMCFGLGLALFALLVATVALCCECKRCNSSHAVAGLLMLGFLVIGVAVVVFGISANNEQDVGLKNLPCFAWSFWLAVASSGLALISAIVYSCEGRARYSYSNTC